MNKLLISFLCAVFTTAFFSCGANKDNASAEKTMVAFYDALITGNIDEALNNCAPEAFGNESKEEWKNLIQKNIGLLGNLQSYSKNSGWNIQKSTETGTTITMKYDVVYEYGKSLDSITLLKSDGQMKILNYNWSFKDASYIKNIEMSEQLADLYMTAVAKKDYQAAFALCGYKAIEITPEAAWIRMLASTGNSTGNIVSYSIDKEKSQCSISAEGGAGKGNYYDVYVSSSWQNGTLNETITCFQPTYHDPLKIISHTRE